MWPPALSSPPGSHSQSQSHLFLIAPAQFFFSFFFKKCPSPHASRATKKKPHFTPFHRRDSTPTQRTKEKQPCLARLLASLPETSRKASPKMKRHAHAIIVVVIGAPLGWNVLTLTAPSLSMATRLEYQTAQGRPRVTLLVHKGKKNPNHGRCSCSSPRIIHHHHQQQYQQEKTKRNNPNNQDRKMPTGHPIHHLLTSARPGHRLP